MVKSALNSWIEVARLASASSSRGVALLIIGLLFLLCTIVGCGSYPEATSAESQELIARLYTACNTADWDRLERVEQRFNALVRDGLISPTEQDAFNDILGHAHANEFAKAAEMAMEFAESQVR